MTATSQALTIGIQHHQAGRLQAAEQVYREILAVEPDNANALHLLGVIASQIGKHDIALQYIHQAIRSNNNVAAFHSTLGQAHHALGNLNEAITSYRQALKLNPHHALAHNNLGIVFIDLGKLNDAVACFRQAVQLKPDFTEAHNNLGNVLKDQDKLDEAVTCYRRALQLKPDYAEAYNNLGSALMRQHKLDDAIACYRTALRLKPDFANSYYNLGMLFKAQGKLDDTVTAYRTAVTLKPDYAEAYCDLGIALKDQGKLSDAIACYRTALKLKPDYAVAHNNLGNALLGEGKLKEAIASYQTALRLKPDNAVTHNNLGNAFMDQGKLDAAVACYETALALNPDYADAHVNRAQAWLLSGDWQRGWPEYEWRWQTKGVAPRPLGRPLWDGSPLIGKTILLHAEQGFGDMIQFVRYASVVKQLGGAVLLVCPKPLHALLHGCPGIDHLIGQGDDLPAFDAHASLMSLPGALKTSVNSVPAQIPYLFANPVLIEQWRNRLGELDGFKIGICWQGNPKYRGDCFRSIALRFFAPLAQVPGMRLITLQKGVGTEQLEEVRNLFTVTELAGDLDERSGQFMDTAAVMMSLDLVITSDTAMAHLAGALGVSVWVALPYAADWRWLLDRSDSPWYPTMRLFRQSEPANWPGVFEKIKEAMCQRLR
jgi:tetratricopeptide (TPR) repeat protein